MSDREDTAARTRAGGAATGSRPTVLEAGTSLGPYRIVRLLGGGGMGEVYEALDVGSGHRLAIKVLPPIALGTASARERFLREGTLAASVNHPNSLYVYGTAEIDGVPLIAMELAPGGTLADRVERDGPMDPVDSARAGLQIARGLEAAAAVGVLHRDVKPSNCFVDRDGTVKVGDYGLSIARAETDVTQLTATGTFLGTPAYASPEQIRGDEVDVRSDIYSVGATLYYLLGGEHLFAGQAGLRLMASILEKEPEPIRSRRPEVSPELAGIVHRCLAKDPSRRFPSYEELCQALTAAIELERRTPTKRARLAAGVLDELMIGPAATIAGGMLAAAAIPGALASSYFPAVLFAAPYLLAILAGAAQESFWGTTVGKCAAGLRVVGDGGGKPALGPALLRSALFRSPEAAASLAALGFALYDVSPILELAWGAAFLLLFLGARRATGFVAIHDAASRTRVVRARLSDSRPRFAPAERPAGDGGDRIGPFAVPEGAARWAGRVVPGYDPTLARRVWIQVHEPGTPPLPEARRAASRLGRLRWLDGRRSDAEAWDAFEAVDGVPLRDAVPQRWSVVRQWVLDLAVECTAAAGNEDLRFVPDPGRIWITADGRAMVLDVPPPGDAAAPEKPVPPDASAYQSFLAEAADRALPPFPPVPGRVRRLLDRLRDRGFESTEAAASAVAAASALPPEVTRARRIVHLAASAAVPVAIGAVVLLALSLVRFVDAERGDVLLLHRAWREWQEGEGADPAAAARRATLETYLAGFPRDRLEGSTGTVGSSSSTPAGSMLQGAVDALDLDPEEVAAIREFWDAHEMPSEDAWKDAERSVREALPSRVPRVERSPRFLPRALVAAVAILAQFVAPVAVVLGFLTGGGLVFRILRIDVVRGDGSAAGLLRVGVRSLTAWAPALVVWWFTFHANAGGADAAHAVAHDVRACLENPPPLPAVLGTVLFLAGAVWAARNPERGLQDVVAGTWLVPR
jgi:uncharacterized RDD family membrane protein YckC